MNSGTCRSCRSPTPSEHRCRRPNWQATVYHGLPFLTAPVREQPGDYLAFLGRISPEKRVDRAIEIARRTGMRLRIAAKVDARRQGLFPRRDRAALPRPARRVYRARSASGDKADFLGNAHALLFPIDWPEPFGLVMIEAMRCGTPGHRLATAGRSVR